jgi:hypothetical protein
MGHLGPQKMPDLPGAWQGGKAVFSIQYAERFIARQVSEY